MMIDLKTQIERKKKKRSILNDFAVESSYIQQLAAQILEDEKTISTLSSFTEIRDVLMTLCDQVVASAQTIKQLIPDSNAQGSQSGDAWAAGSRIANPLENSRINDSGDEE